MDVSKDIEEREFTFDGAFSGKESDKDRHKNLERPRVAPLPLLGDSPSCFGTNGSRLISLAPRDTLSPVNTPRLIRLFGGISFHEIYCSGTFDLLGSQELSRIRVGAEEKVDIVGLAAKIVSNTGSLMTLIKYGRPSG